jgi:hypothetical protein
LRFDKQGEDEAEKSDKPKRRSNMLADIEDLPAEEPLPKTPDAPIEV